MTTITRARLTDLGWEADLAVETVEVELVPAGDEVLVEVEACGVCYRDCIDRAGRFKFIQVPITPGHEAVGVVAAIGPDVVDWAVGDRVATMHRNFCGVCGPCGRGNSSLCEMAAAVLGLTSDGGYATKLLAPQRCFFAVSAQVEAVEAAVLHCTFGTAYRGMAKFGGVEAGSQVLVTGANGGVGTAAVQVAKRLGATVTAVVRDETHEEMLAALGADKVLVDDGDGFHKRLGAGPVDVVMECVGPPTFNASLRSLRAGGRMIVIGNVVEDRASLNLGFVVTKGLQLIGSSGATREDMAELFAMHAEKPFDVQIHERVALAEADRAQRMVQTGGLAGRVVLIAK